jgi:hypothetical protein
MNGAGRSSFFCLPFFCLPFFCLVLFTVDLGLKIDSEAHTEFLREKIPPVDC